MHVLRAEKGFIVVGQETDGSVTPIDLGMGWILSKKKDFLGRRSLERSDCRRADRRQLVGLATADPNEVLPEGAQLVEEPFTFLPAPMVGYVTSSYWSPNVGRSIALALVAGGGSARACSRRSRTGGSSRRKWSRRCSSIPAGSASVAEPRRESPPCGAVHPLTRGHVPGTGVGGRHG